MSITPSRFQPSHPDRDLELQEQLEPIIQSLLEDAQQSGWSKPETFDAIEELIKNLRLAYAEDPDPADDPT